MADVTAASNVSDDDVMGAVAVTNGGVPTTVWTPEVVARVTTIVVIMVATLTGNVALIVGITYHAALRRRRVSAFLVNLAVGRSNTSRLRALVVSFSHWTLWSSFCTVSNLR